MTKVVVCDMGGGAMHYHYIFQPPKKLEGWFSVCFVSTNNLEPEKESDITHRSGPRVANAFGAFFGPLSSSDRNSL